VVVPQEGLEPPHPCEYQILSLARLPVPPLGLRMCSSSADGPAGKGRTQVPASAKEPSRGWDGSKDRLQSKGRRLRTASPDAQDLRRRGRCCSNAVYVIEQHIFSHRTRRLRGLRRLSHAVPVE
jgi:hypothetical protein